MYFKRKGVKIVYNNDFVHVDDVVKGNSVVNRVIIDIKDNDDIVNEKKNVSVDENGVDDQNVVSGDDEVDLNIDYR